MLSSYLLSLREGLEAALIIGIVLGTLRKIQRPNLTSVVWYGVFSAIAVSLISALLLTIYGLSLEGETEAIFEGITMLLAAGILTWMIFWMSRQAQAMKINLEDGVHQATEGSGKRTLFGLAFMAVLREGIELALFLTAAVFTSGVQQAATGALLGLGTAILLGWSLFTTSIHLDLRRFFQVTGLLLILFAAGLIAHSIYEFNEIGWIPVIIEHVWDINTIVNENSPLGEMLKALFGYNSNPSLSELAAYLIYYVVLFLGIRRKVTFFGYLRKKDEPAVEIKVNHP